MAYKDISVDLKNLFLSLSSAMEETDPILASHQLRTAFISWKVSEHLKLPEETIKMIFLGSLFHDIGALSHEEKREIHEYEETNPEPHCIRGEILFNSVSWLKPLSKIIRNHHRVWKKWDEPIDAPGVLASQILFLADNVERKINRNIYILHQDKEIISKITSVSGKAIHPQVVDSFLAVSKREEFWLDMVSSRLYSLLLHDGPYKKLKIGLSEIMEIALLLRNIIDYRSRFTATHSSGVAECATLLSRKYGLTASEAKLMEIAGHCHDLGKLNVPNSILEKDSKLTDEEFAVMRQHTYYTFSVLNSVGGLEQIAPWAAYHHEKLDGTGYPFHLEADNLTTYARIMAVADVCTALVEDRPYRLGMKREQVWKILEKEVNLEHLDKNIVTVLLDNYDEVSALMKEKQGIAMDFYEKQFVRQ